MDNKTLFDKTYLQTYRRHKHLNSSLVLLPTLSLEGYQYLNNLNTFSIENKEDFLNTYNISCLDYEIRWTLEINLPPPKDKYDWEDVYMNDIHSYYSIKSDKNEQINENCLDNAKNVHCEEKTCFFCSVNYFESGVNFKYSLKDKIIEEFPRVKNSLIESRLNGFEFIEKIVKIYEITDNKSKVDSVKSDSEGEQHMENVFFFHGTSPDKVTSILNNGLECKKGQSSGHGIYLTPSSTVAALHASKRSKGALYQYIFIVSINDYLNRRKFTKGSPVFEKNGFLTYSLNVDDDLNLFPQKLLASGREEREMTYMAVDEIVVKDSDLVELKYLVLVKSKFPHKQTSI